MQSKPLQRFYIVDYAREDGIIVAEGRLTAKTAVVEEERRRDALLHYGTTFRGDAFMTDPRAAKIYATNVIEGEITRVKYRLEQLERRLQDVRSADLEKMTLWTKTG